MTSYLDAMTAHWRSIPEDPAREPTVPGPTCGTCIYRGPEDDCRRWAPRPKAIKLPHGRALYDVIGGGPCAVWPLIDADADVCGEWEPIPE